MVSTQLSSRQAQESLFSDNPPPIPQHTHKVIESKNVTRTENSTCLRTKIPPKTIETVLLSIQKGLRMV